MKKVVTKRRPLSGAALKAAKEYDPYKPVFDAAESIARREGLPNIGAVFHKAMELRLKRGPIRTFKGRIVGTNPKRKDAR